VSRIIINFPDSMEEEHALSLVESVIRMGRISDHEKQYCYASLTDFHAVYATLSKTGTDSFSIVKRKDL